MVRVPIPLVVDEYFFLSGNAEDTPSLRVGTPEWYLWLAKTDHRSFSMRCYAGGFTAFAFTRRLKLSGQSLDLHLRSRSKDRSGHRQVWYVLEESSTADYVLDTGDKLYVRKTVL